MPIVALPQEQNKDQLVILIELVLIWFPNIF